MIQFYYFPILGLQWFEIKNPENFYKRKKNYRPVHKQ